MILIDISALIDSLTGPRRSAPRLRSFIEDSELPFGPAEADLASALYKTPHRPRGRELDLAIAAHAILQEAILWTFNTRDFEDISGLDLVPSPQ